MRLVSFAIGHTASWGVLEGPLVYDVGRIAGTSSLRSALDMDAINAWTTDLSAVPALPQREVRMLAPVPDAGKILCVGLNYADHIREMNRDVPDHPTIFTRFADSLVGDGEALVRPRNSTRLDYEGELAVVIGRSGRHVTAEAAADYVLGYTIMNDGSVRDYQRHTTQFTPGKNFPHSGALGPWIMTADEFGEVADHRITTRVNGKVVQDSTLDQLIFGVPQLVAYISEWTELQPGDVIATGTPGGVGDGRQPPVYLTPGDRVDIAIEGLGALTNSVVAEPAS